MASYFRQVPNFAYISRDKESKSISEYTSVKNLFKRAKLREDIFANLSFFTKYNIIGDERPDNVAYKIYGDETLDWVVLISNNILNIQTEWPLSQNSFDQILLEKYGSYENLYSGIHHYETIEIKNSSGITVLPEGLKMPNTWRTNGNFIQVTNSKITNIFAGDGQTASNTVTVVLQNGIEGLTINSQILISNISKPEFNGKFLVSSILNQVDDTVSSFTYELTSTPNTATPTLSTSQKEEAIFTVEGNIGVGNAYYYEYYDAGLEYYVTLPSSQILTPITNYQYEEKIENEKRNIYLLKPRYLNVLFNDMKELMTYKRGATQFISSTLKRGDNIRLFE